MATKAARSSLPVVRAMSAFYRSRIILTVLSEAPLDGMDVGDILYECDEGSMVLGAVDIATTQVDRATIDQELHLAGSDPSFFQEEPEEEPE
jgi:hypothetical protein